METGRFWPICPFGARNGQICPEFLLLCCRARKGRFSMETGRFWPICPFGAQNGQMCIEFLLLCCRPRKGRFSMEMGRFWPICLLFCCPKWSNLARIFGPFMVKFASNFCYCALDQEKAVFQWKRAVSGPSALLGPEIVKFAPNFCFCAVTKKTRNDAFPLKNCLFLVFSTKAEIRTKFDHFGPQKGRQMGQKRPVSIEKRPFPFFNGNGPFLAHLPF